MKIRTRFNVQDFVLLMITILVIGGIGVGGSVLSQDAKLTRQEYSEFMEVNGECMLQGDYIIVNSEFKLYFIRIETVEDDSLLFGSDDHYFVWSAHHVDGSYIGDVTAKRRGVWGNDGEGLLVFRNRSWSVWQPDRNELEIYVLENK